MSDQLITITIQPKDQYEKTKTFEFHSLASADKFFWNLLSMPFVRNQIDNMTLKMPESKSIMKYHDQTVEKKFVHMNKPYNNQIMKINNDGQIISNSAWNKSEYDFAILTAQSPEQKSALEKNRAILEKQKAKTK